MALGLSQIANYSLQAPLIICAIVPIPKITNIPLIPDFCSPRLCRLHYAVIESHWKDHRAATAPQRARLARLAPAQFTHAELAGEKIEQVLDHAPGNGAAIGGIKVIAKNGWFAARPSGTEDIYKIYAESFLGEDHLTRIVDQAQTMVDDVLRVALT